MAKKGKANTLNLEDPQAKEIKELEERRKELQRRLQKVTDPLERRRLEQEVKVLGWRLQRLRVRPHIAS
jgi:predicted  nucleic acid-binding Zn-ribbon protein